MSDTDTQGSGMADEASELVEHIHVGLREGLLGFLHIGWAMHRIVETQEYMRTGTIEAYIADHLPISRRHAYRALTCWRTASMLLSLKTSDEPSHDWTEHQKSVSQIIPILTSERALLELAPAVERGPHAVVEAWAIAKDFAELAEQEAVTAKHVKRAVAEVCPPPPTPKPETVEHTEESAEELCERALGHLARNVRSVCEKRPLIPEVATAIVEGAALRQIAGEIDAASKHLEALLDHEICAQLEIHRILPLLEEARRKLLYGRPFGPCPYCWQVGRKRGNCDACRPAVDAKPLGWVNRSRWGSAPSELRQ